MLNSILSNTGGGSITLYGLVLCTAASLLLGVLAAGVYMFRNTYSKSFVVTLALLPAMVQAVIMLVNGNLGTGVAVMGAFSLVRFRSVPGSAREIGAIFLAMALGLATGMGYIGIAALFLLMMGLAAILLTALDFGERHDAERSLKVTIPEALDYTGVFDDLFQKYTASCALVKVKTTNLGSLYELHYHIRLRDAADEKRLIDDIRCRNGNLGICCGKLASTKEEL